MPQQVTERQSPTPTNDFVEVVLDALEAATGDRHSWRVDPASDAIGTWIYVDKDRSLIPSKGWKLHISATPWSAAEVLDRTLPILLSENACFKFAASIDVVASINEGEGGLGQIGKFMTIYPNDDAQALSLAGRIHEATKGLAGPEISTDKPLAADSLVHYRFGEFVGELEAPPEEGERFATDVVVPSPTQTDVTEPDDPFARAGIAAPPQKRLIGERYLITSTLYRSPRGSVHLAADLIEPGSCVLKRAARWGRALPDGSDARDLLRREAELLELLVDDPHFPEARGLIEQGDLYLVMELLEGPTLARMVTELNKQGRTLDLPEIVRLGRGVAEALGLLHSKGLVYRDLNPENVIVANGEPRLIDLELTTEVGASSLIFVAGTPDYAAPEQLEGSPASPGDDIYALGALLSFAATGQEPSASPGLRATDDRLRDVIDRCMAEDASKRWPSMATVDAALGGGKQLHV